MMSAWSGGGLAAARRTRGAARTAASRAHLEPAVTAVAETATAAAVVHVCALQASMHGG